MGKGENNTSNNNNSAIAETESEKKLPCYTIEEINKHQEKGNAWIVVKDTVYDVSNWDSHPGGLVLFTHAGADATDVFGAFHPASAFPLLSKFRIGKFVSTTKNNNNSSKSSSSQTNVNNFNNENLVKEFRELRNKFIKDGLFEASFLYYVFKCTSNLAILATACYCVIAYDSLFMHTLGAMILALFWQQCGWLAHDFLHHQVFKNRFYGDLTGVMVGNAWQGFSVAWWKNKHNTHHAVPNMHDEDPDISTDPILAWSRKIASKYASKSQSFEKFLIQIQPYTYYPILMIARFSWAVQSILYVANNNVNNPVPLVVLEAIGLFIHWAAYLSLMYFNLTFGGALWFFFVSQATCGFLLALVFGVGHNGMETFELADFPNQSFLQFQVLSTRNVDSTPFVDWFMGGLQYQVEHHLFPMIPRHNLGKVRPHIEALCKKYNIPYHSTTLWQGQVEVVDTLYEISRSISTDI